MPRFGEAILGGIKDAQEMKEGAINEMLKRQALMNSQKEAQYKAQDREREDLTKIAHTVLSSPELNRQNAWDNARSYMIQQGYENPGDVPENYQDAIPHLKQILAMGQKVDNLIPSAQDDRVYDLQKQKLGIDREELGLKKEELNLKANQGPDLSKYIKSEGDLRQEFDGLTKDFRVVNDANERIKASAQDPSAAGDLAMIYNYMKILDPGSTVREGEFATAQNSGSVPDRVVGVYNRILDGERLSSDQREDFSDRAQKLFTSQAKQFNKTAKRYQNLANEYGFRPNNVATPVEIRIFSREGQTATNPKTGERIIFKDGKLQPFNSMNGKP